MTLWKSRVASTFMIGGLTNVILRRFKVWDIFYFFAATLKTTKVLMFYIFCVSVILDFCIDSNTLGNKRLLRASREQDKIQALRGTR